MIDKFHVLMKASEAVDKARNEIQNGAMNKADKARIYALRKAFYEVNPSKKIRKRLNFWFNYYPDLYRVWQAKERFHGFFGQKTVEKAREFYEGNCLYGDFSVKPD